MLCPVVPMRFIANQKLAGRPKVDEAGAGASSAASFSLRCQCAAARTGVRALQQGREDRERYGGGREVVRWRARARVQGIVSAGLGSRCRAGTPVPAEGDP